jgi:hypothetical protein
MIKKIATSLLVVGLANAMEGHKLMADEEHGHYEWTIYNYIYVGITILASGSLLLTDPVDHCGQLMARVADLAGLLIAGNEGQISVFGEVAKAQKPTLKAGIKDYGKELFWGGVADLGVMVALDGYSCLTGESGVWWAGTRADDYDWFDTTILKWYSFMKEEFGDFELGFSFDFFPDFFYTFSFVWEIV